MTHPHPQTPAAGPATGPDTGAEPAARVADATAAGEALAGILEAENQALAARDWPAVARLAAEKRSAGDAYAEALTRLTRAGPLSAPAREALARLTARIGRAAEDNERRLTFLMFAQRRVIEAIADAVASLDAAGYARSGDRARAVRPALSLDRAC